VRDSKLGFGLLGAGLIAPFHSKALQASELTELIAVADLDAQRVEKITSTFGCKGYGSLDAMVGDPDIDVISVITPNHLHHDAVLKAAAAGKHVLIEKPPAMSLAEVDSMTAACKKSGVKACVSVQCRMRKAVQAIKTAIDSGRFGKIYHADTYMKWFRSTEYYKSDAWRKSRRSGAGVTINQAFHYVDLLQYLVGPAKSVQARMNNLAHPEINLEDTLISFVDYECGAQGVVQASTALWPGTDMRLEINGENGTAIMVGERMEIWKFRDERPEDAGIRAYGSGAVATGATGAADLSFADHQVVIEDLAKAILSGGEPTIRLETVRPTLEWSLAMYKSAKIGAPVSLPIQNEETVW
jgi:UDP-N-acetyl-2-amino-2-deoxyglucuronate dehydrogenase